jgi:glycosyltransferase involved in cell wall biosynthesis
MKIGYLTLNLNKKTGGGRFVTDIIDGVKAIGHEVIVLKELNDGLEGLPVLCRGWKIIFHLKEWRDLLKDCDVIHAFDGYPYGVIAWLINRKLHKRLIISAIGTYSVAPLYRWQTSFLLKQAYKSADKVVSISSFTQKEILKKVALNNAVVVTPGINISNTNLNKNKTDGNYVLGIGAIKERKGYHIALSAFAKIAKDFPHINYVIVADLFPPFQAILDKIIEDNNLIGRVTFLHDITEEKLIELYNNATLFVLTPINAGGHHFEGFGLVYLEAARAGLPVIGTLDTGGEDAIKDGYNGILVPQNDIDRTAKAMTEILSDKARRDKMSQYSYDWAHSNSIENEVDKFLIMYKD